MAYNGSGTFVALTAPNFPAVDGNVIVAAYYNAVIADLITGLNKAICRDGQSTATADLPMGGFTLSGIGAANANGEPIEYAQFLAALANLVVSTSASLPANTTIGSVSPTELAYLDGLTANIETAFAKLASPAFTGVPTAPTAAPGTNTTQLATMAALYAAAMNVELPGQSALTQGMALISGLNVIGQAGWGTLAANGNSTLTTSAVDIQLTAASTRVQGVTMTAADKAVKLPDLSTLTLLKGSPVFVVPNTGKIPFKVTDYAGNAIALAYAKQTIALTLISTTTGEPAWKAHNWTADNSPLGMYLLGTQIAASTDAVNNAEGRIAICALSDTQFLYAFANGGTSRGTVRVANITGVTPTFGTAFDFSTVSITFLSITALTSSTAVVSYHNGTTSEAKLLTVNTEASTVTAGAAFDFATAAVSATSVDRMSDTTAQLMWRDTSNNLRTRLATVSGTSLTGGTVATIQAATATTESRVASLSATKAIGTYILTSTGFLRSVVIDITGTASASAGDIALTAATTSEAGLASMYDGERAIVSYNYAGSTKALSLKVSGTTITPGTEAAVSGTALSTPSLCAVTGRSAMLNYASGGVRFHILLTVRPQVFNTVDVGEAYSTGTTNVGASSVGAVSPTGKYLGGFRNSSTFVPNAIVLELMI